MGILPIALQSADTYTVMTNGTRSDPYVQKRRKIAYSLIDYFEAEIPLSDVLDFICIVMVFEVAGPSQTCSFLL